MNTINKHERSLFPETRDSAREYLKLFKAALAAGEQGPMTGEELRSYDKEIELKASDPKRAVALREQRLKKRAAHEAELRKYYDNLRKQMER